MKSTVRYLLFLILLAMVEAPFALGAAISVCDYKPPESRITDLSLLGSFNWYDGPFADDRNRSISANLVGDYTGMLSSASFGQSLDARTEFLASDTGWTASVFGSGSLSSFFAAERWATADLFGVGVVGFSASSKSGVELDLTGGVGAGRFRDVTPLAQAIEIQNRLLDLGELLAPLSDVALLELAQIVGDVQLTDEEIAVAVVDRLLATDLILGKEMGVRGLLAIEDLLQSGDETRLCGRDFQARIGVSAVLLPQASLSATGITRVRYAAVPDPVSQFDSSAEAKFRLLHPQQMNIQAKVSYARRLPDGWTARAEYRVALDRMWSNLNLVAVSHAASGSLTTQIFGAVGISIVGSAQYYTGDEEGTLSLAIYMETDLF